MAEERAQRRLAAIIATDVVGFSRLMERDEAGTLATLRARPAEVLKPTGYCFGESEATRERSSGNIAHCEEIKAAQP